jgi:prolyl oligopeptidase
MSDFDQTLAAEVPRETEDPYLWLEAARDPAALAWISERTAAAKAALTGLVVYPVLLSELQAAIALGGSTPLTMFLGNKLGRVRKSSEYPHGVLELAEYGAGHPTSWRKVFDIDAFNATQTRTYEVQWQFVCKSVRPPHYDRCLLPLSPGGGEEAELREFDLVAGVFVEDGFRTAASQCAAVWLGPDQLLISHTLLDAPRSATGGAGQAYIWDRGTELKDARAVLTLAPSDALMLMDAVGTGTARRAIVTRIHNYSSFSFAIIDPDGGVREAILPRELKPFGLLAATERHFFVQLVTDTRIGGQLCKAESLIAYDMHPDATAGEPASLVYTFNDNEFANDIVSGFAGTRTGLHFIVDSRSQKRLLTARFDRGGWSVNETRAAPLGETLKMGRWGASGNQAGEELWVEQTGYLTPTRIDLVASGKTSTSLHADTAIIDADAFRVEQRSATSRDGVEIDYYLLQPRSTIHKGAIPTLMTGYGAFGFTITPAYFDNLMGGLSLKLWLDRGGALAMPLIRGGGDRGSAWHTAALREKRQTSYDDFIAVAEDLIVRGFTTPRRLGVFGSSNGGLLAATVAVQRPDLFSAVVSDVPVLDMLRYHKMGIGAGLTNEFGDPDDPLMRKSIERYSPYQNLRSGRSYPPFLLTASTEDDRVGPGHARKFTARAEEIGASIRLIEESEGGHTLSNSVTRPVLMAMRMAFLIDNLMGV